MTRSRSTTRVVRRLLAMQMPHLADLPLVPVEPWGTDRRTTAAGSSCRTRSLPSPACHRRRVGGRDVPRYSVAPPVDRMPSVSIASLMVTGSPCNGPRASPRANASSAAAYPGACALDVERHDCVQRRVEPFDAIEVELEQFAAPRIPGRGSCVSGRPRGDGVADHRGSVGCPRRRAPGCHVPRAGRATKRLPAGRHDRNRTGNPRSASRRNTARRPSRRCPRPERRSRSSGR